MSAPSSAPVVSGLVVVDKPGGITSHGVVARVRKLAGTRKVGHAGTLDPMATGVLVLGTNRATRLLGHLMLTDKAYDATILLGVATTTDDAEGEVVATAPAGHLTEAEVCAALEQFVGHIEQVPTAVSAIKVDGKRAYERVRAGEDVQLKARPVTVHAIEVHAFRSAATGDEVAEGTVELDVSVRCTSGTYIRAIARDLGNALGVGGHLTALRRTAVGAFGLEVARTLGQMDDAFAVLPIADAARMSFPAVDLDAAQEREVRHGRRLDLTIEGTTAVFSPEGEFLALYEPSGSGAKPLAVFVG